MSEPNWREAVDEVLADLLRYATYRFLGHEVDQAADCMHITLPLADRYEATIRRVMADLTSEAAPVAPGAAPDPLERNHRD